ncbi:MAG: sulfatase-like hydrolase/transferase, partial [Myxococcota bacterium]|nr:sulfatase-like hydrolase/transferase [Myxococcota bacterium]
TRLVVANLHDMDRAGHYGGPTAYPEDVQVVDEPIAQFWEWIQSSETYADRTVLVLVSDHGRHRWDEDEDWRNHGDQCAGCREIPMFMAGPGIRTDTTVTEPYTLVDVGRTVAWLLGVELPYSTGRLMCDVLTDDPDGNPTGQVHPAMSGSLYATQQWAIDDGTVTQVVIDGEVLSSELALHAEAPVLLSTEDHEFACWRELVLGTGTLEDWAWQGECRHREPGGAWTDLEFPDDAVWPFWKPSLEMDDGGRLWVAYVDNQNGGTSSGQDVAVRVLRWTSSRGWEGAEYGNDTVYYPTSLSMKLVEDGALIAFARSSGTVRGRYTRHVEVNHVTWTSAQQPTWARALITQTLDQQ